MENAMGKVKVKRNGHLAVVPQPPAADEQAAVVDFAGELVEALSAMSNAALTCEQGLKEVAAERFAASLGKYDAIVIERSGSGWCCVGGCGTRLGDLAAEVPETIPTSHDTVSLPGIGSFISVTPDVGVLTDRLVIEADRAGMLRSLAIGFNLALTAATQYHVTLDAMDEIGSLQQIAKRILSASKLDEVLFSITRESTRLLGADIGGVFLRDGNDLVMSSCVGNDTLNIDRLRMKRGQGLAGRVFETARPCKIDDYLGSEHLNRDFFWLAQDESISCAVGAPLNVDDEVIGVLEVWRRRNVPFTDQDTQRLITLANLTTIAIQNARLYDSQMTAMRQLTQTNENLRQQNEFVRLSAQLQDDLIGALLDSGGVVAIARIVARHAAVEVAILGTDFGVMAAYPTRVAHSDWLTQVETISLQLAGHTNNATAIARCQDAWLSVRPIVAGGNRIGWVCMLSPNEPDNIQEIAICQAAVASALYCLEQRSASQARASALGALMWDLLEGTPPVRQSALDRLKDFHIELQGPHRVVHCAIDGLAKTARGEGWNMDTIKHKQSAVREACERVLSSRSLKLIASRGDLVVAIISTLDVARATRLLKSLHEEILAKDGVRTFWGVSAPCESPSQLPSANDEAKCAALAVAKLGTPKSPVVIHEHLGVLALLLQGSEVADGQDMRKFVNNILGPMLKYDSTHHGVLAKTIRAYLDNDCSMKLAAQQLFVHEKTVRYRLNQFEELTGIDLRRHRDRMSVDLALLMHNFSMRSKDVPDYQ